MNENNQVYYLTKEQVQHYAQKLSNKMMLVFIKKNVKEKRKGLKTWSSAKTNSTKLSKNY